jgi:hypothetical protein
VKLLLDGMHAPSVADTLTGDNHDVVAIAAVPGLRGLADRDLLERAAAADRALVTENVADYSPLPTQWATEGRTHAGLIFTNPKRFDRASLSYPGNLIAALRRVLDDPPIDGSSWTWWL